MYFDYQIVSDVQITGDYYKDLVSFEFEDGEIASNQKLFVIDSSDQ